MSDISIHSYPTRGDDRFSVIRNSQELAAHLTQSEAERVAGALSQPFTAAEAVYGFCAWLTANKGLIECGSNYDAAPLGKMLKVFCEAHNLGDVTKDWPKGLESSPTHDECESFDGGEAVPSADSYDPIETAWGIIANAADWLREESTGRTEWIEAAERWRDRNLKCQGDGVKDSEGGGE